MGHVQKTCHVLEDILGDDMKVLIGIPTPDMKCIGQTLLNCFLALSQNGHEVSLSIANNSFNCAARTEILNNAIKNKCERILWLDSDSMIIDDTFTIASILKRADDDKIDIVGNYRMANGKPLITETKSWERVSEKSLIGLGFCYCYVPKKPIVFSMQSGEGICRDESTNFFSELDEKPVLCPIQIVHVKTVTLMPPEVIQ